MKRIIWLLLTLASQISLVCAQESPFETEETLDVKNINTIKINKRVTGYYFFYKVKNLDHKSEYNNIRILDLNLKKIHEIEIVTPDDSKLNSVSNNGEAFLANFSAKGGKNLLVTYSKDGGKITEKYVEKTASSFSGGQPNTYQPLGTSGFVLLNQSGFSSFIVEGLSNDLTDKFVYESEKEFGYIDAQLLYSNENLICLSVFRKKNKMSTTAEAFFRVLDSKNGKIIFEKEIGEDFNYVLSCEADEKKQEINLVIQNKIEKTNPLHVIRFDYKGNILHHKKLDFNNELVGAIQEVDKGKEYIHFLDCFKNDKKWILVGERYIRKNLSVDTKEIVVFEFSPTFEVLSKKIFNKNSAHSEWPGDDPLFSREVFQFSRLLDFAFIQINPEEYSFDIIYQEQIEHNFALASTHFNLCSIKFDGGDYSVKCKEVNSEGSRVGFISAELGKVILWEELKKVKNKAYSLLQLD